MDPVTSPPRTSRNTSPNGRSIPGRICQYAGDPLARTGTSHAPATRSPGIAQRHRDRPTPAQPPAERRHRHRRVLVQQSHQSLHVMPLERLAVPAQQRLLHGIGRSERLTGIDDRQRRPRPLQCAVRRRHRDVQQRGDLGSLPRQHITQDQHGALTRRQVLQRGHERQPDGLAANRLVLRQHQRVRHGLHEHPLRHRCADVPARWSEADGQGAPLGAALHVDADVRGDAVEPGAQRRARGVVAVVRLPCAHECFLRGVLGLEAGAEHAVAVAGQLDPERLQRLDHAEDPTRIRASSCGTGPGWTIPNRRVARVMAT